MQVRDILRTKGADVEVVTGDQPVTAVISALTRRGVGALVVSPDGSAIDGIVSERDIVRLLHRRGPAALDDPVSTVMTRAVHTCELDDHLDHLMQVMTDRRIRHLPVVENNAMVGIVSIGDVVKRRLDHLEEENRHLTDYISGTGR